MPLICTNCLVHGSMGRKVAWPGQGEQKDCQGAIFGESVGESAGAWRSL